MSPPTLDELSDEELLELRLSDLQLKLADSPLAGCVDKLYEELESRGLRFRPHAWLSDSWFSPVGIPGIGIPFYLAHHRLMKLEKRMMLELDGSSEASCLRILRHEAGHAFDTAYRLHFRRDWQQTFGSAAKPYPKLYRPRPNSRRFVHHLADWYAQAHPSEDFAETFAVWLRPGSRWRVMYKGWPALKKLHYVDRIMEEIANSPPSVSTRRFVDPITKIDLTLAEFYEKKQQYYGGEVPAVFDRHLFRIFGDAPRFRSKPTAVAFLRKYRAELRELTAEWTGTPRYTVDQLLNDISERCKELQLRLSTSERETKHQVLMMLAVQTMHFVLSGHVRMKM